MKSVLLLFKLWRAGYRAARGLWWLTTVTVLSCFLLLLYMYMTPFVEARNSIYSNLAYRHTTVERLGTPDASQWEAVCTLLEESRVVDYYILKKPLKQPACGTLNSISTVIPTNANPYAWQKLNRDLLCDSQYGEPLPGCAYINREHAFAGTLNLSDGDVFSADELSLTYVVGIWGDDLFDILINEKDFAALEQAPSSFIYGISPFATRSAVEQLNRELAKILPQARFSITFDRSLGVKVTGGLFYDPQFIGVVCAALLAWFLLYRHWIDLRARQLAITRLLGCRRRTLFLTLTGEAMFNTLLTFAITLSGYALWWAVVEKTPRNALLLCGDALRLLGALLVVGAVIGAAAARRVTGRVLSDVGKGGGR
ncbi:MAG: FtsX-like permease family protein [Ruminococcaceae bacterium]|nr:FtsX-like permease family protein [Oscillospiraceae bacterium]